MRLYGLHVYVHSLRRDKFLTHAASVVYTCMYIHVLKVPYMSINSLQCVPITHTCMHACMCACVHNYVYIYIYIYVPDSSLHKDKLLTNIIIVVISLYMHACMCMS